MNKFITLIILFQILISLTNQYIELEFKEDKLTNNQKVEICFGIKEQCFNLILDINSIYSFVQNYKNPLTDVKKINEDLGNIETKSKNERLRFPYGKSIKSNILQSSIFINSKEIKNITYASAIESEDFGSIDGIFGLGYSSDKKSFERNIIGQLGNLKKISDKVYTISYSNNIGTIKIGYIPNNYIDNYLNIGFCAIEISLLGEWSCSLNGILLGTDLKSDKLIEVQDQKFTFDYNSPKIIFPVSYLLKLEKEYFGIYVKRGDCYFGLKNDYYTFTCKNKEVTQLYDITLKTDYWGITIPIQDLFIYDLKESEYDFQIFGKDDINSFIIGMPILKDMELVFNYDREEILFSSKNKDRLVQFDKRPQPSEPIKPTKDLEEEKVVPENNKENTKEDVSVFVFIIKVLISIVIVLVILYVGLIILRNIRKKKFVDPNFYYKATQELFSENT